MGAIIRAEKRIDGETISFSANGKVIHTIVGGVHTRIGPPPYLQIIPCPYCGTEDNNAHKDESHTIKGEPMRYEDWERGFAQYYSGVKENLEWIIKLTWEAKMGLLDAMALAGAMNQDDLPYTYVVDCTTYEKILAKYPV